MFLLFLQMTHSLRLWSGDHFDDIPFEGKDVSPDVTWKIAEVKGGKWALYNQSLGKNAECKTYEEDGTHNIPPDFSVKSARGLDYEAGGLLLFSHHNYVGPKKVNSRFY